MNQSLLATLQEPGSLRAVFQPVFELVDRPIPIHALEASLRGPAGTHFESRTMLLEYVSRKKAEALIDRDCVSLVCAAVQALPKDVRIQIPVHTSTLIQNPGFVGHLELQAKNQGLALDRFTIELLESESVRDEPLAGNVMDSLRQLGVRIALSGFGLGSSAWRMLVERSPDYWKLASFLADGVNQDFKKRAAVESILSLAKRLGCSVVAAGIESEEDLATLAMLGVQLVQADFLCRAISVETLLRSGVLTETNVSDEANTSGAGSVSNLVQ